jgi:hypothetical protein
MNLIQFSLVASVSAASRWHHSFDTVGDMWFSDFGYSLLSQEQATFIANNYKVVSLEKCTGRAQGIKSEAGIYQTAMQLKKINPSLKVTVS